MYQVTGLYDHYVLQEDTVHGIPPWYQVPGIFCSLFILLLDQLSRCRNILPSHFGSLLLFSIHSCFTMIRQNYLQSSSVVESHSVQSQFVSLTKDRETLRLEIDTLERSRRRAEASLLALRELQGNLGTELSKAHATMGRYQKTKDMMHRETLRLSRILATERSELEQTQLECKVAAEQEKQYKEKYVEQMQEHNKELEHLVQNQEQSFLASVLASTEGVAVIVELAAAHNKNHSEIDTASIMLHEALAKKDTEQNRYRDMEQQLKMWRARVLATDPVSHMPYRSPL